MNVNLWPHRIAAWISANRMAIAIVALAVVVFFAWRTLSR